MAWKIKIKTVQYARENKILTWVSLPRHAGRGDQYAHNVVGWTDANSTEFDMASQHPVVGLITEWQDATGATEQRSETSDLERMRLGAQDCQLQAGSRFYDCYGKDVIVERHRHRYEVNNQHTAETDRGWPRGHRSFRRRRAGQVGRGARIIRGSSLASSTRNSPPRRVARHPLFSGFVNAALAQKAKKA